MVAIDFFAPLYDISQTVLYPYLPIIRHLYLGVIFAFKII